MRNHGWGSQEGLLPVGWAWHPPGPFWGGPSPGESAGAGPRKVYRSWRRLGPSGAGTREGPEHPHVFTEPVDPSTQQTSVFLTGS